MAWSLPVRAIPLMSGWLFSRLPITLESYKVGAQMAKEKKAVLLILDGWGYRSEKKDNAIASALTPYYSRLFNHYPYTVLQASESFVGLPHGVMGNSEVGHTNIGCGRRVEQEQVRIYASIKDGSFFTNPTLIKAIATCKQKSARIHLMGLTSTGNVHSAKEHYYAMLEAIERTGFDMDRCFFHAFLDGRDTAPKSAQGFLQDLDKVLLRTKARLATVIGRFYAMDRDKRMDRTQAAYDALVRGQGVQANHWQDALESSYQAGITDEFVKPIVLTHHQQPIAKIENDDLVICFNFRADRMRQLVRAFLGIESGMQIDSNIRPNTITMTPYEDTFGVPILFSPPDLSMCLGEYFSKMGKSQFRCAETEKYAHVTFFFNGGRETPFDKEERLLIPSPKVTTYDQTPAMNSALVTKNVVERIQKEQESLIVVNYAQPDMVGHTGNWDAAITAVEATDIAIRDVCQAALDHGYMVFLTADHGNIEMMKDPVTHEVHTSHTLNPVPLILIGSDMKKFRLKPHGSLSNIAPTMLQALDLQVPKEMTAPSLLVKN